jgi:penicillin-binding protein 1A
VRISAGTGQLARAGDRNVIYEPFKPGTAPHPGDTGVVLNGSDPMADAAGGAVPASAPVEESTITPPQAAPAGGTGGLY